MPIILKIRTIQRTKLLIGQLKPPKPIVSQLSYKIAYLPALL